MILRLLARGSERVRPTVGWPAFCLVWIAVWSTALGVMDAEWVERDVLFFYIASVSALLSALLAHSRTSGRWSAVILAGTGLLYTVQAVARILPPLVRAVSELWSGATWLWLRLWQPDLAPPPFEVWTDSGLRLATFAERLSSWGMALATGPSDRNPVAFLFVAGLITWVSTAWALWATIRRGQPLLAMLPLGLVLGMSTYLSTGHIGYLISYAGCVTLLLPVVHLSRQEWRWERDGVDYSPEIRFDVWQLAVVLMLIVLLLAIVTPSLSIPRLVHTFWQFISRPQAAIEAFLVRFFGGVEPIPPTPIPVRSTGASGGRGAVDASLPRAHLLGGNPELSNWIVMDVCTDAPAPMPIDLYPGEIWTGPKTYWRGITYDTFNGQRWSNGPSSGVRIAPYEPVLVSTVTDTLSLRQRYLIQVPHGTSLYAVGEPDVVDQPVLSRRRAVDDLVSLEGTIDDYVVRSKITQASARELESATEALPERISARYLEVHDSLPAPVRDLAAEIVQDAPSSYAKATAIERYLRQFPYDLTVPSAPSGQDVVEYFIFDAQRGYCDYYASSFVVLTRLVGVPSRLAVGYTMGGYDPERNCYRVTEMNAHSWPEVYFPEYGWIPFEPTAAFSPFERPQDSGPQLDQPVPVPPIPRRYWHVSVREWWAQARQYQVTYVVLAGGAALALALIVEGVRRWRRNRLDPIAGIALCYEEMSAVGRRLDAQRRPIDTPAEYSAILTAAVRARVARWPWRGQGLPSLIGETGSRVGAVSSAYERASYSAHSITKRHQMQTQREWQQLRRQLRWLRLTSQGRR